jgi:ABC-type multidrug transport system fused ATPase/permease subunit
LTRELPDSTVRPFATSGLSLGGVSNVRMLRLTLPIVLRDVLRRRLWALISLLAVLSILLGTIPALKSQLESQIVNIINNAITEDASRPASFGDALQETVPATDSSSSDEEGLPERIASWVLKKVPELGDALLFYLFITAVGYALGIGIATIRANVTRTCFARLRVEGLRKGLLAEDRELYSFSNIPGQYAMAIQQGATNVSSMYGYALEAGQYVFALGTTIALVWTKSPAFGISCLGLVLLQASVSLLQAKRLQHRRELLDAQRNNLVGRSDDIISKRDIILAYEQETRYVRELDALSSQYADVDKKLEVSEERYRGASTLITDIGRIAILLVALLLSLGFLGFGAAISSIGDAYFLISIYVRLFVPASNLLNRYDDFKRAQSTSAAFLELLQGHEVLHPLSKDHSASRLDDGSAVARNNKIEFDSVSFRYEMTDEENWVLNGCTFRVPANKTTLLVGPSGSGKTTIARILLGFATIELGEIWIDGRPISSWSPTELRLKMSYVSQGDHIVDDTVRANFFANDDIPAEDLQEILRSVRVCGNDDDESFLERPAKNLSTGQQQRLALARMILDKSELTIMDEPLSGVDVFTFSQLLEELVEFLHKPERTVLMFSHRLAFAAYADHVVVLGADGRIEEEGSLEELRDAGGTFSSLYAAALAELEPVGARASSPIDLQSR